MNKQSVAEKLKQFGTTRGNADWAMLETETARLIQSNSFAFLRNKKREEQVHPKFLVNFPLQVFIASGDATAGVTD